MADLTRFDFHALRFNKSEAVQSMTAEEVGQYILLLVEAWLMGKGASLPDDIPLLSRLARVRTVSDKVLSQFPVEETEFGSRRRNSTLYSEWALARERTAVASKSGRLGSQSRWGGDSQPIGSPSETDNNPYGKTIAQTNPNQSVPDQSIHTNPIQRSGNIDFKTIRIRYRAEFGKMQSDSKKCKQDYYNACQKYGEDIVLKYFDEWAPTSKAWIRDGYNGSDGLQFFYRKLDEMVEGDALRVARENPEPEVPEAVVEQAMVCSQTERTNEVQEKLNELRRQREFDDAHKDEI